jgi:YEATS domain-containing protein 4
MEKAEWNRLNDARIKVIEEMDRWREVLIAKEREIEVLRKAVGR